MNGTKQEKIDAIDRQYVETKRKAYDALWMAAKNGQNMSEARATYNETITKARQTFKESRDALEVRESRCSHCGLIQDSTYGKKLRIIFERSKDVCAGCGIPLLPVESAVCEQCGKPLTESERMDGFCRECEYAQECAMDAGTQESYRAH